MSEPKSKVKGIKTGFIILILTLSFLGGAYLDDELPIIWSCVTAEGL